MTARLPVVGCATQLTEKVVAPTNPASSETVRGFAPLTVQFRATPERSTVVIACREADESGYAVRADRLTGAAIDGDGVAVGVEIGA